MSMLPTLVTVECGKGKVKQKTGIEHDINKLVARFKKTGVLPSRTDEVGVFLDTTGIGTFQDCMEKITSAQELWLTYPLELRRKYNNDIGIFAARMSRLDIKENRDLAIECGLIEKPKEVKPEPQKEGEEKK